MPLKPAEAKIHRSQSLFSMNLQPGETGWPVVQSSAMEHGRITHQPSGSARDSLRPQPGLQAARSLSSPAALLVGLRVCFNSAADPPSFHQYSQHNRSICRG